MSTNANLKRRARDTSIEPGLPMSLARTETAPVEIGLNAAIVAVVDNEPVVLVVRQEADGSGATDSLPFGPFSPVQHRTFESGLRAWVRRADRPRARLCRAALHVRRSRTARRARRRRTAHRVDRLSGADAKPSHRSSCSTAPGAAGTIISRGRTGATARPELLDKEIEPRLKEWAERPARDPTPVRPVEAGATVRICFGLDGAAWDEEKVLDRYELLYEAGLVDEARRDGREAALAWTTAPRLGAPMRFDHRRILATAIGRVRAKIKYRPVDLRADAGRLHAVRAAEDGRGHPRPASAQAEFPPPGRERGARRADGRGQDAHRRTAGASSTASAARCCSSARHRACASNPDGPELRSSIKPRLTH